MKQTGSNISDGRNGFEKKENSFGSLKGRRSHISKIFKIIVEKEYATVQKNIA